MTVTFIETEKGFLSPDLTNHKDELLKKREFRKVHGVSNALYAAYTVNTVDTG